MKKLILLGKTRFKIEEAALKAGMTSQNIIMTESMEEAVQKASQQAEAGDVVLLSPACASWDMFDNFEQRGEIFAQCARKLAADQK